MRNNKKLRTYTGSYTLRGLLASYIKSASREFVFNDQSLQIEVRNNEEQPGDRILSATQRNIFILFLGEIYNLSDLMKCMESTENNPKSNDIPGICCQLYARYGMDFLRKLNGQFSLILYDEKEKILIVAVDRYGLAKPIYYQYDSRRLVFSSHLKTLMQDEMSSHDVDPVSLKLFLKFSYISSPRTIMKNIKKLGPGERLVCKGESLRVERYIDFQCARKPVEERVAIDEYIELLSRSLSKRLSDVRNGEVGIFLSGGLDSSANVALASKISEVPLEAFGIGFEDINVDERPYARILAKHYDIFFHDYLFTGEELEDLPKMLWYLEEPFLENGLFLTYAGFKSLNQGIHTVITGNCTDQLFGTGGFTGGMPIALRYVTDKAHIHLLVKLLRACTQHNLFYQDNLLFKVKVMLDRVTDFNNWFFWGFDNKQLKDLCAFSIDDADLNIFPNELNDSADFDDYYQYSIIHHDLEHYACQNVTVKTHRMAEMFGVRARDPYLDYDLVDFILSLDLSLKRKGSLKDYLFKKTKTKYLHRLAMKDVLPQKILSKPKQGGSVVMTLLLENPKRRGCIFDYIRKSEVLRGFLNMQYVSELLKNYNSLASKEKYWQGYHDTMANQILYLLTFAIWAEVILSKRNEEPNQLLSDMLIR